MDNILKKTIPEMIDHFKKNKKFDTEEVWEKKAEKYKLKKTKNKTWRQLCESYTNMLCHECHKEKAPFNEYHNIRLCMHCRNKDEYVLVCKTIAKKTYHMKDDDFEGIHSITAKNPHCRRSEMTLFGKKAVIEACKEKYNFDKDDTEEEVLEKLDEMFAKNKHSEERKAKALRTRQIKLQRQEAEKARRKNELVTELRKVGVNFRDDSNLCVGYINDSLHEHWNLPEIVNRMCEMKYLYNYCDMNGAFKKAKEERQKSFLDRRECGPLLDEAEEIALRKNGGKYPENWPWLVKKE